MDLLPQADRVVFEERLYMFPTTEGSNTSNAFYRVYVVETGAPCIAVHSALHMGRFELAALHDDGAGRGYGALCDVERIVIVF